MFLQNLRSITDPYHKALERNHLSVALMDEKVSREDLGIYLKKLYGFVQPFETHYYPMLNEVIPDLESRKKLDLLSKDLEAMGIDITSIGLMDKDRLERIYPGLPEAVGGLYVLEGSVLGGAIIHRHLSSKLGDYGGTYFPVYGKEIGPQWKSFIQQLETYADEENEARIIEGAKHTFVLLDEWLGS